MQNPMVEVMEVACPSVEHFTTSVTAVKTLMIPEEMNAASAASDMTSKHGGTVDVSPP